MRPPHFLVTGSGHCGTGYLAALLNECGMRVGHENWWGLGRIVDGLDGDVSWLGCFDDSYAGRVLAQVRDPRKVIPSLWASNRDRRTPWTVARDMTVTGRVGDPMVDAAITWHRYTEHAIGRAERWWRVEDVTADLVADVFGIPADVSARAVTTVPTSVNHKATDRSGYVWADHPAVVAALEYGRTLGYE